jgi:MFS family permease
MHSYYRFFLTHPRILGFGVLLTLFSSFGQTFLISIFVPKILGELGLTTGMFGALYAGATIGSAVCLPFFGRLLDRMELRRYTLKVGAGLMFSCFAVALAPNAAVLFASLFGLRLTGQGLLSLTASTTMARLFTNQRGRALSLSGLGYPLGEGVLPLVVVLLINTFGWRVSWGILGVFIGVVMLPLVVSLLHGSPRYEMAKRDSDSATQHAATAMRSYLLRDPRFYLLLPGTLALPVVLTGLFLYQIPLADFKGWTAGTMASAFVAFAVARMVCGLCVGPLIDRLGALRLFPFYLLPTCFGLSLIEWAPGVWPIFAFLGLAGVSQGCASAIMTAVWAELYGRDALGSVKSVVAMLGVLGTAFSPVLVGWLLQTGVSFGTLLPACLVISVAACALSFATQAWMRRVMRRVAVFESDALPTPIKECQPSAAYND